MDANKVRIAGYKQHSFVNGPGSRFALFMQGCPHRCKNCQNPETWDMNGGKEYDTDEIIRIIRDTKFITGVTFSGGDPVAQPKALAKMITACKNIGLDIWVYTGWTYETLVELEPRIPELTTILDNTDVLVDGRFIEKLKSEDCIYRGSTNQRLIDVPASRKSKIIILHNLEHSAKGEKAMTQPANEAVNKEKIYTHDEAARLLDMFEEVLDRYQIHVPSPEDDEREEDNMVGLYGSTYSNLLDEVEAHLINLLNAKTPDTELVTDIFSGTY